MSEQQEVLRRIAERGLKLAQKGVNRSSGDNVSVYTATAAGIHGQHLDLWQHMLDELERLQSQLVSRDEQIDVLIGEFRAAKQYAESKGEENEKLVSRLDTSERFSGRVRHYVMQWVNNEIHHSQLACALATLVDKTPVVDRQCTATHPNHGDACILPYGHEGDHMMAKAKWTPVSDNLGPTHFDARRPGEPDPDLAK